MDCHTFENILAEFEDRSLGPAEQDQASRHLMDCASCRSLHEIARGRLDLLVGQEREEMAGSILSRTSGSACHRAQELICDFIDNALDPENANLVSEHLDHCIPCRSLASDLQELKEILPRLAEVPQNRQFTESVMAATAGPRQRPHRPAYPRLGELWNRLIQRPRFSFEAAYAGTLAVAILLGNPFPTAHALSVRTLETVSQVLPRDLEKNRPEFLLRMKSFASDVSRREQSAKDALDRARVRSETVVTAAVTWWLQELKTWRQAGLQSVRGFLQRLRPDCGLAGQKK